MATLSQIGIPGSGLGILAPYREWLESDKMYALRIQMIKDGRQEDADKVKQILREAFYSMKDILTEEDVNKLNHV